MIWFDVTKSAAARHRSGLVRVNQRLREELGDAVREADWKETRERADSGDWFVTSELFSEEERPGFSEFIRSRRVRTAAIFADAIPLKFPHITWPHSVARHPAYMKMLASFDRVWAISGASQQELIGFWHWQGLERVPPVEVLTLGADFNRLPRVAQRTTQEKSLLCLGILEPRKNQSFLLEVCADLWSEGLDFALHVIGRVNPHFGPPIVARLKALQRTQSRLHFHESASDAEVRKLYAIVRATVFPTMAEGCGLPVLESLWMGIPSVCSDLPVLRENADGGGCWPVAPNDPSAWKAALRHVLTGDECWQRLSREAVTRSLPTWGQAAETLRRGLS